MFFLHISSRYAKILGGNYFAHGSFPEVGQKQSPKREEIRKKKERKSESVAPLVACWHN